jgi:hypothetical protein
LTFDDIQKTQMEFNSMMSLINANKMKVNEAFKAPLTFVAGDARVVIFKN